MNKPKMDSLLENLLKRFGGRYPFLIILLMQVVNTPLMVLMSAVPAQQNASFSESQGINLLVFGTIALLIRNAILLLQDYLFNKDMIWRLSKPSQQGTAKANPKQEKLAWEQASTFTKRHVVLEFLEGFTFVLVPLLAFAYFSLHLEYRQIIYLALSVMAASLVNLTLEYLTLDQWFKPVLQALLPRQFDVQITGIKGIKLWVKLSFIIMSVVMIGMLLTIPAAYHQVITVSKGATFSPNIVSNALLNIVKAGMGVIVSGIIIIFQLVPYLTNPFRRMINLFKKIESGDLSQRIDISLPDEFGKLNIYINHMIDRLQKITSTLEQQVLERTTKLKQANEQLQLELMERKRMEEQLVYTALHDPLTDLPNRVLFMDRLDHAIKRAKRNKNFLFGVLFMDLDRFKVVNDSQGHAIGDLLLIESGRRLIESIRAGDTAARLGGDEFVVLLEDIKDPAEIFYVANRIIKSLAQPANLEGQKVFVSVSMGIVVNNTQYKQPEDIVRDADIAMYRAKSLGRNRYEVFDPKMLENVMARLELETDLWKGLENHEFIVYYQPILDLKSLRIIGFEALLRWQHPTRGLLPPADFIPVAEEIGLIIPVGYWVLEEACRQIRTWQKQFPADPPLSVSVNLSTRQCTQTDLVEKLLKILQKNNLESSSLKLELTESLIIEDSESISAMLNKLRDLGIQVQIDDFGTGYSSLSYLNSLPIDTLKIDRSFISRLGDEESGFEIVRTIMALAHNLGMKVVAEGVETKMQLSSLETLNCEFVQGFLFAKPVGSLDATALLEKSLSKTMK